MELISQIRHIYDVQGFQTQILAASIRNALHIVKAAEAGADVCTCPLDSILGLLKRIIFGRRSSNSQHRYSQAGLLITMFSGYFKPVALYMSTAAPTIPPISTLPTMAIDGKAGAVTVKRSTYWPLHEILREE